MYRRKLLLSVASMVAIFNLGAAAAVAQQPAGEQSSDELAQEIQALRDKVEALQRRLDAQIEAQRQAKDAADAAAALAAEAKAATATIPAQVQNAVDAVKPKTDKIYYKGVTISLGGFVAGEGVYRSRNTGNDIATAYNQNYYSNNAVANTSQTVLSARQSQFSALVSGSPDPQTHLGLYTEFDFQGAAQTANSQESNSYNPSLRQLYGTVDWDDLNLHLLAGQAWSLVTLNGRGIIPGTEIAPPVIDGQYMPGFTWARQPLFRITQDFDKQYWVSLSLENPQTTFYTGPNPLPAGVNVTYEYPGTGLGFNTQNSLSLNRIPDVILKAAADPEIGNRAIHLEAYGVHRNFDERLNYENQSETGGGFGGGMVLPLVPKYLDFQVSGLAGKGIGRYGSGQLADVTFDASGRIQPIHEVMAMAGLTLHTSPRLEIYLFAGEEKDSTSAYNMTSTDTPPVVVPYGYGNKLYSNTGCFGETAVGACIGNELSVKQGTTGFWDRPYVGSYGTISWGLQYSHTEFKSFPGVGGAPVAIENMVFASFRYYPFNY